MCNSHLFNDRIPVKVAGILILTNSLKTLDKLFNFLYTMNGYSSL